MSRVVVPALVPPHIDRARTVLAAALADEDECPKLDCLDARMAMVDALCVLEDVTQPYPPPDLPGPPHPPDRPDQFDPPPADVVSSADMTYALGNAGQLPVRDAVVLALSELAAAIDTAGTVEEAVRAACASRLLRDAAR